MRAGAALSLERPQLAVHVVGLVDVGETPGASRSEPDVGDAAPGRARTARAPVRLLTSGRSWPGEPSRSPSPEERRVLREHADVDVVEAEALLFEPAGEAAEIGPVRPRVASESAPEVRNRSIAASALMLNEFAATLRLPPTSLEYMTKSMRRCLRRLKQTERKTPSRWKPAFSATRWEAAFSTSARSWRRSTSPSAKAQADASRTARVAMPRLRLGAYPVADLGDAVRTVCQPTPQEPSTSPVAASVTANAHRLPSFQPRRHAAT